MSSRYVRLAALVAVLCGAWRGLAQSAPTLGSSVASYAALGRTNVTNSGPTIIAGNVGASAGGVTGDPLHFVIGEVRTNEALARQAQEENAAAYAALATLLPCTMIDGKLSGQTFKKPGVYCLSSPAMLSATQPLTIDADGNPDGPWIFRTNSLTTAPGSIVRTTNGAKDSHVFWQVAGPATFGARSVFLGNVLALGNITVNRRANVSGRLLSQAAVTLDDAAVTICCDLLTIEERTLPDGATGKTYGPIMLTARDGKSPYTFAVVAGQLPPDLTLSREGLLSGTPTTKGEFKVAIAVTDASGFSCIRVYLIEVVCPQITLPDLDPPTACTLYERTITPTGGTPSYTLSMTPEPSCGLRLLTGNVLSWTPPASCSYDFTITATDAQGCQGSRRYTGATGPFELLPETLPEGEVGKPYSVTFEPDGTYTFSGDIPPGLTGGQTFSGIPTKGGCYTVRVEDPCGDEHEYTLIIRPVPVTFTPDPLPHATLCARYCQTITAFACNGKHSVVELSPLPSGFTFDPDRGEFCVTPQATMPLKFTVTARDGSQITTHPYTLEIDCPKTLAIDPLPDATACVYYKHQLNVPGYDCPLTFAPETLPNNLKLSPDGLIYGCPASPGDNTFDVTVTPKDCPPITVSLKLHAMPSSPQSLPSGRIGKPYSRILSACGGTPPCTLVSGPLPPGLTLMANCTLSGVPTTPGCFPFTVRATGGCEQSYVLCILPVGTGAPVLGGWGMGVLCAFLIFVALLSLRRHGV